MYFDYSNTKSADTEAVHGHWYLVCILTELAEGSLQQAEAAYICINQYLTSYSSTKSADTEAVHGHWYFVCILTEPDEGSLQ